MASFLLSKTYGLSNHTLKENQSPSCQSKPQSSAGHMVRPPLHRLHNCCRKQCSPVRYTCMHTPALHCSVLLGVLFLWCMLCLINVPLPTGRGGGGAGRGPHVPDQPPQGSLYRMPSQMTPPQAATVFYNSQYGWVLLSPIRFSCSPSLKSLEPGRRNTYSRSPDPCTAQPSWAHDDALVIWALPDCLRTRVFVASAVCVRTCLYHRSCPSSSWDPSTPQLWIINWQGRHMSISRPCHSVLSLTSCSDPERIAIVTR